METQVKQRRNLSVDDYVRRILQENWRFLPMLLPFLKVSGYQIQHLERKVRNQ